MARLFHIGAIAREPAQAGIGVGDGGGNRLIHFVRQGGSQLSHGGHAADMGEIRLRLAKRFFGQLALGDVRRAANELRQIPGCVQNRMADSVYVFDSAAWKKDSEFHFVTRLFSDCSIDCLLPPGSILRMNALQPFFPSRRALFWIEAIYAVPFLGQMQGVSSRYPPGPTPRMREPLRFRQITLASPQCFFSLLALSDIRHRSHEL